MDLRSRTFVVSSAAVLGLVVLCALYYMLHERAAVMEPTANSFIVENEQANGNEQTSENYETGGNVQLNENSEPPNKEHDIAKDSLAVEKTPASLASYNPLEKGYNRVTDWAEWAGRGALSAAASDFHNVGDCRRVVVFLGRDVLLGHVLTACDSLEPSMGLVMADNVLHYWGSAVLKQGPVENVYQIIEKVPGDLECVIANYTLSQDNRPSLKEKSENTIVDGGESLDCTYLLYFKMPKMLFLSGHGATGLYAAGLTWATINPWEPLGVVTKVFWYGPRCFRLLIITSYGRSVQAAKVTCGPVENMVITKDAIYYGNALVARQDSQPDTFVFIYNPKRTGECSKKTVLMSSKDGRPAAIVKSKKTLSKDDAECLNVVNQEMPEATVPKDDVEGLVEKLSLGSLGVEPHGTTMSDYEIWSDLNYINLSVDLGMAIRRYKRKTDISTYKLVLGVAKGVPLVAALFPFSPVHRLVMREGVLYYNTTLMMKRTEENTFITLVKISEESCLKKTFLLTNENRTAVKKEVLSAGEVRKKSDEDCLDLIEGRKLKNPKFVALNYETDDIGIPKYLPEGLNIQKTT